MASVGSVRPSLDSDNSSASSSGGDADVGRSGRRRRKSGSMIVSRDSPHLEVQDEIYEDDDARAMSPRRSSKEVEKMGEDVRRDLQEQAKVLQAGLLALLDRVDSAKAEYDKLEGENRFLQSYIGELMATSKITSTSGVRSRGGRSK